MESEPDHGQSHPSEGDDREVPVMAIGVGSELSMQTDALCSTASDPGEEQCQRVDQQQHQNALGTAGLGVLESEAELMGLQGSEAVLDTHANPVQVDGIEGGSVIQRQRVGDQPGFGFPLCVLARGRALGGTAVAIQMMSTFRRLVNDTQSAFERLVPADPEGTEIQRNRCGIGVERLAGQPIAFLLDQCPVPDPTEPMPAQRFDIPKPGTAKAGIGDDDGTNTFRQHLAQGQQKLVLHGARMLPRNRMDFLVDRQGKAMNPDRGPQQLQGAIRAQVRPVDDHHRLTLHPNQQFAQQTIDWQPFLLAMPVAQQAIHALDPMPHVTSAFQTSPQCRKRQSTAPKGAVDGCHQNRQTFGMNRRNRTMQEFLQHCGSVHGTVSVQGWSPITRDTSRAMREPKRSFNVTLLRNPMN